MTASNPLINIPKNKIDQAIRDISTSCEICAALKQVNFDARCEKCTARITAVHRYARANIPIEFWNNSMEQFKGSDLLRKVYKNSTEQLSTFYNEGWSFLLSGTYGVGKTLVVSNILKIACQKGFSCLYTTLSDIVSVFVEAPYEDKFLARKEILNCDFLVLDEIDPRHFSNGGMELFGRTLESMIRTRFSNKLPNIFITNSPNMLEAFKGEIGVSLSSLFSRVKEFSIIGNDYRKVKI